MQNKYIQNTCYWKNVFQKKDVKHVALSFLELPCVMFSFWDWIGALSPNCTLADAVRDIILIRASTLLSHRCSNVRTLKPSSLCLGDLLGEECNPKAGPWYCHLEKQPCHLENQPSDLAGWTIRQCFIKIYPSGLESYKCKVYDFKKALCI